MPGRDGTGPSGFGGGCRAYSWRGGRGSYFRGNSYPFRTFSKDEYKNNLENEVKILEMQLASAKNELRSISEQPQAE